MVLRPEVELKAGSFDPPILAVLIERIKSAAATSHPP
jgi:hypothetical protein